MEKLTREEIEVFELLMISKCDDPGRASMVSHICSLALHDLSTLAPSAPTEREKASAWRPISEVGTFEEVTVYEAGNGQAIGYRDLMGEWWTQLPLRPLNMNPTHFKPLDLPPAPAAEEKE